TCALRAFVSLFERGDVQINAGKIVENDSSGRTTLELGKRFDVTKAAIARVDHRARAGFFRHQRDQLLMVGHAAVRAKQTVSLPLSAATAAAKITAPLDAAHFGKCRPGTADWTIPLQPAFRYRERPAAIVSLQEGNG